MKKILICSDKYKGSLTSNQVNQAIHIGITAAYYPALCDLVSMSDGGDGFLASIYGLEIIHFESVNALQQPIMVPIGYKQSVVYIEVATVIGIAMLGDNSGSIWQRSSFGLGQLIYNILSSAMLIDKIVIGCGGSSTNDAGFGLLCGLGAKFHDKNNQLLMPNLKHLIDTTSINLDQIHPKLHNLPIEIIADVKGDLNGSNGCTKTFAWQKGATNNDIELIELAITHFQQLLLKNITVDINLCGYGLCCGGLAAAFSIFPNTQYYDGANWVIKQNSLEAKIAYCDMVFSGEGKVDTTSLQGKLIQHIARLCKKHQKPLIVIAGQIECELEQLYAEGITCAFSIINQAEIAPINFADSDKLITSRIRNLFNFAALI